VFAFFLRLLPRRRERPHYLRADMRMFVCRLLFAVSADYRARHAIDATLLL